MRHASLLPLFAIAACATAPAPPASPDAVASPAGTCRTVDLTSFVGQPQSDALGKRMLAATGARTLRWVEKDMMVTMEFREDRLTAYLDAAKRVERASCG